MVTKPGRVVSYNEVSYDSFHKITYPVGHVGLVILISLIQFAGLDCKCLSLHRLLLGVVRKKTVKNIY